MESVALIMSQAALLNAEIAKMQAANSQYPNDQPYNEATFAAVIDQYSLYLRSDIVIHSMIHGIRETGSLLGGYDGY